VTFVKLGLESIPANFVHLTKKGSFVIVVDGRSGEKNARATRFFIDCVVNDTCLFCATLVAHSKDEKTE
jgi:hypothetical protein